MLKVLQILGSLGCGGAETMVMNYYREAVKRGCQFDFVVHAEAANGYESEVRQLGGQIIRLDRPGEVGAIRYVRELREAITENGPYGAIHAHTNEQGFMAMIAGRFENVPVVAMHAHSTGFSPLKSSINRLAAKCLKAKRLACGEAAGRALYGRLPFEVVPNAISVDAFCQVTPADISKMKEALGIGGKRVIGHVGRFIPLKNHAFLIHEVAPILRENRDVVVCLVGDGETRGETETLCDQLGVREQVLFLGVRRDMPLLYSLFDLSVLPSDKEGFPLTVMECQAAGKICLCSDAVTRECDMGLGLVEYLPLEKGVWRRRIGQVLMDAAWRKPDAQLRKSLLAPYEITGQCGRLLDIYGGA